MIMLRSSVLWILAACMVLLSAGPATHRDVPPAREEMVYPKDYFQSPIKANIRLTGTFGELRSNHFHSGVDIDGHTGDPVLAAADGYVARIKVQASGYGHVLYVKHPNGYTTVYAHLDRFAPEIQQFLRIQQYRKRSFEVDLRANEKQFPVKKGQEIGKLGNTGGSSGPHLHFEVRHTASQKCINPLLCDIPVNDQVAPEIRDMKVYFLGENREVLGSKAFPVSRQKNGVYGLQGDTVKIGAWRIGFGVKTYDSMTGMRNDNGVYSLTLTADGQTVFNWNMAELDLDETRYLNAHSDYSAYKRYGAWFHKLFVLPGDKLSNYSRTPSLGAIPLFADRPVLVELKVMDAYSNTTTLSFWAQRDAEHMEQFPAKQFQFELPHDAESNILLEDFYLKMPRGALYEPLRFQFGSTPADSKNEFSCTYHLHDEKTPVQRYFEIGIKPVDLPEPLKNKAVIAKCGDGRPDNCGNAWNGAYMTTKVREFGQYCIMIDTVAPRITPVVFQTDMRKKNSLVFKISDNFAVNGLADRLYYRGTIDDEWVLFEYDAKRARLTHVFDGRIKSGQHTLRLVVRDDRDNTAIFEKKFTR
jgi:murein DD-endopeptidase MepM/ murein hydrolase activator NlpD